MKKRMMDGFAHFLDRLDLTVIVVGLIVAHLVARELGGWIHNLAQGRIESEPQDVAYKGYILSAVLGLLALLIAFTFSLSLSRFESRRTVIISEANAIGTAEMRAHLLPAPSDAEISNKLRNYARTRLAYGLSPAAEKIAWANTSGRQRAALQTAAISALRPIAATPLGPFVGESINSVLDVGVEREALNAARLPGSILAALMGYSVLAAFILGYALTGAHPRQRGSTAILFALLTLATSLILDLDRPQRGTIRIDQTPMRNLVAGY